MFDRAEYSMVSLETCFFIVFLFEYRDKTANTILLNFTSLQRKFFSRNQCAKHNSKLLQSHKNRQNKPSLSLIEII